MPFRTLHASLSFPVRLQAWMTLAVVAALAGCGGSTSPSSPQPQPTSPAVSLSTTALTFTANVGSSSSAQTVTVTNSGTAALSLASIALSGTNASQFSQTNTCASSLAVNAICTVSIIFSPTATGSASATLALSDNASTSPQSVSLTGTGMGVAGLTLSSTSLSFGSVNVGSASASQSVTLTNSGTGTLTIGSIALTGVNTSSFTNTTTCGVTLSAAATCSVSIVFAPATSGALAAGLTITSNAPSSPQTVALSGTGVASTSSSPTISGTVYTGNAAIAKGTVTVYAPGQGTQQTLATTTVDANGNYGFNSSGKPSFTCTPGLPLYLTATNIVPHAYSTESPTTTPSALLVSAGNCGSFSKAVLNELTTVAGLSALNNFVVLNTNSFLIEYGFPATSFLAAFTPAQAAGALMVDTTTGNIGTDPTFLAADKAKLSSLADALYACTSADPAAGTGAGTPCGTFFAASITAPTTATQFTTPTNSLYAMIFISKFGSSISSVYALPTTNQPYQPIWKTPPADFVVRISPATAAPTLTPAYVTGQAVVTMASATAAGGTPGAAIWYTTDGSTPSIGGATSKLYLSPVSFYSNVTVKAIAQEFGMSPSAVTSSTLNITAGPHLVVTFPVTSINTGANTTGTVSLSGAVTSTLSVTLSSAASNALSFAPGTASQTATVQLSATQPTATFTIYGLSAGTSSISASAGGVAPGAGQIRSTSLLSGVTTSTAKSPIYGFSAVNSQAFNNISAPAPTENDAYQVNLADPARFAASLVNVTWAQLEPSQGSFDFSPIEQALTAITNSNASNHTHVTAKIRLWAGSNVPAWLIAGEPDGQGGAGIYAASVGTDNHSVLQALSWSADYEAHFQALVSALAAEYDQRTMVQEVVISPCTNSTDEPYIYDITTMTTGYNGHPSMRAVGFTDAARMSCLEDAPADYAAWSLTPLYLPFNALVTTDGGHSVSYVGFAFQQMQNLVNTKLSEAIIGNQDLQPIACLFDSTCASSGPIFDMFPFVSYKVSGVTYPANVSVQITPQGSGFASKCSPNAADITCYSPFIEWAVTPSENGATTSSSGFHVLELELYPTIDDKIPSATGATVSGTVNLTSGNLGTLNAADFPKFVP